MHLGFTEQHILTLSQKACVGALILVCAAAQIQQRGVPGTTEILSFSCGGWTCGVRQPSIALSRLLCLQSDHHPVSLDWSVQPMPWIVLGNL